MAPEPDEAVPRSHGLHSRRPVISANEPAVQDTQDAAPDTFTAEPAAHGVHTGVPGVSADVPGSQSRQALRPACVWYRPMAHAVQVVRPVMFATLPAAHAIHDNCTHQKQNMKKKAKWKRGGRRGKEGKEE